MKVRVQFETEDPEVLTFLKEPRRSENVAAALAVGVRYLAIERRLDAQERQLTAIQQAIERALKELSEIRERGIACGDLGARTEQGTGPAGGQPVNESDEKRAELERKAEILAARLAAFGRKPT